MREPMSCRCSSSLQSDVTAWLKIFKNLIFSINLANEERKHRLRRFSLFLEVFHSLLFAWRYFAFASIFSSISFYASSDMDTLSAMFVVFCVCLRKVPCSLINMNFWCRGIVQRQQFSFSIFISRQVVQRPLSFFSLENPKASLEKPKA